MEQVRGCIDEYFLVQVCLLVALGYFRADGTGCKGLRERRTRSLWVFARITSAACQEVRGYREILFARFLYHFTLPFDYAISNSTGLKSEFFFKVLLRLSDKLS